jgi:hypothetical protein
MRLRNLVSTALLLSFSACSTTPVAPIAPPAAPLAPGWASVPHPAGFDLADIEAIFLAAPPVAQTAVAARPLTRQEVANCDRPFRVLKEKTISKLEFVTGIRELVRTDPVAQHWCFYGKILEMEQKLKEPERLLKGRQQLVLETFEYLTPVARAFYDELNESRYWRWAIQRYRLASDRVFFQRVEPSAETTSILVTAVDPFAWVRPGEPPVGSVLQKYGLLPPPPSAVLPPAAAGESPGSPSEGAQGSSAQPASDSVPAETDSSDMDSELPALDEE